MIETNLKALNGKIYTDYNEHLVKKSEVDMIIAEIERIKLTLLMKEFDAELDLEIDEDGEK